MKIGEKIHIDIPQDYCLHKLIVEREDIKTIRVYCEYEKRDSIHFSLNYGKNIMHLNEKFNIIELFKNSTKYNSINLHYNSNNGNLWYYKGIDYDFEDKVLTFLSSGNTQERYQVFLEDKSMDCFLTKNTGDMKEPVCVNKNITPMFYLLFFTKFANCSSVMFSSSPLMITLAPSALPPVESPASI